LISRAKSQKLKVTHLCKTAEVSESGYYKYLKNKDHKKQKDAESLALISQIFHDKKSKAGIRTIQMILERKYGVKMNLKKIARIKKEYGLETKIRKKNPHNIFAKKSLEARTAPNILRQKFRQKQPNRVYSTDISYLFYADGKRAYLSATKDLASKEIVAFNVSQSLGLDTAYKGLDELLTGLTAEQRKRLIIHSDQGTHYTHPMYIKTLKKYGVTQSMSRKGNCLDNAPIESFFGHFKDEMDLKSCKNYEELEKSVAKYVNYYNNERAQWGLKKMTPAEYRCHLESLAS